MTAPDTSRWSSGYEPSVQRRPGSGPTARAETGSRVWIFSARGRWRGQPRRRVRERDVTPHAALDLAAEARPPRVGAFRRALRRWLGDALEAPPGAGGGTPPRPAGLP